MKAEFNIGIQALCLLAEEGRLLNSEWLARKINTNSVRVRNVLRKLSDQGYVEAVRGARGGYKLLVDPDDINLGELMEMIEVKPFNLRSTEREPAPAVKDVILNIYGRINQAAYDELEKITIQDVQDQLRLQE